MKVHILDIQDGNGCRLVIRLTKDEALQAAQDWLNTRPGSLDFPEAWLNQCIDTIQSGTELRLANLDYIVMVESEIDLGFVIDALEDAQLVMGKLDQHVGKLMLEKDRCRLHSKYLATEQVIHLTLQKLKGQP